MHRFHRAANFAVLAFAKTDCKPGICTLLPIKRYRHGLEILTIDGDALAQRFEHIIGGPTIYPHAVAPQPAVRGQFQPAFDLAVIGQQQQPFGVKVKATDAHDAGHVFGQIIKDRAATFFVAIGGHQPRGLVVQPDAGWFGLADGLAVHSDCIGRRHVQRGRIDLRAVDPHAAGLDHTLCFAAAGKSGTGQDFGNTVTGWGAGFRGLGGCIFAHTTALTLFPALAKGRRLRA